MAMVLLGIAAFRRDGRSLATVVIGLGKFAIVWGGWVAYGVAVTTAAGGLATALLRFLLGVDAFSAWQP
jgi:type IV secretion system protein TrbL